MYIKLEEKEIRQGNRFEIGRAKTTDLPAVRGVRDPKTRSLIAEDTNDPKCLGFHSVKPRKVRGRSTSPEGRAVLHQAVDKSFGCGQELRWAEIGLCTMEDSQSEIGLAAGWKCGFPRKDHGK